MKYVKIPVDDMAVITAIIDLCNIIVPDQYKDQVSSVYKMLHGGKFEILEE